MAATAKPLPIEPAGPAEAENFSDSLLYDPRPRGQMNSMVLEAMRTSSWKFWLVTILVGLFVLVGFFGVWGYLIASGLGIFGLNRPDYWAVDLANVVYWIGISHTGAFVSALLRLFKTNYHHAITRVAEFMAVFGIIQTGLSIFIHLGRVWVTYWLFPYPNVRTLWPDFHSPLMWDFMAINTYLIVSALYLFLPMIPDVAMARDRSTGWRKKFYRILALGFRGTEAEWTHLKTAIKIFSYAMLPVMASVTTIVAWDFAMATRPNWSSTVFGPYFVIGAIHAGIAMLAVALFIIRSTMKNMKYFIRPATFDGLGKLILIISMFWAYFYFNDYLPEWYGGNVLDRLVHTFWSGGYYSWMFLLMFVVNALVPWLLLWNKKIRRTPWVMFLIGLGINFGMWSERFLIIAGSLTITSDPFTWQVYHMRWPEVSITLGTFAFFALFYLIASKLIPMVSAWEVQEGQASHSLRKVGKADVPTAIDLD